MKKYYSLFLFWSLLTGLSTSCSDDNKKIRIFLLRLRFLSEIQVGKPPVYRVKRSS